MSQSSDIQTVQHGDWQWTVVGARRTWLAERAKLPWTALTGIAEATPIKSNALRSVWRLDGDPPTALKVYRHGTWWARVKQRIRGHAAESEFRMAVLAASKDLPVIRPVACGRSAHGAVFVSEWVDRGQPLDTVWRALAPAHQRCVAAGVGRLLARLRAGHVLPRDVHPGNLLLQAHLDGLPLTLVDLYGARPVWGRRAELQVFVDLHQWFGRHARRSDQLRCLAAYLPERSARRAWIAQLLPRSARRAEELAARRDRRIFGDGRHVAVVEIRGTPGWAVLRPRLGCGRSEPPVFEAAEWAACRFVGDPTDPQSHRGRLELGSTSIEVVCETGTAAALRARWIDLHRAVNRNRPGPQPLLLSNEPDGSARLIRTVDTA